MKTAVQILTFLLALLSVGAGGAKLALVPEEAAFLAQFGFSEWMVMAFGAVQFIGGILMVIPVAALAGATVAGLGFTVSSVLLVVDGNLGFAAVSVLPVALVGFVAYHRYRNTS